MTTVHPTCRARDPLTLMFAAALDGDLRAEDKLRALAIDNDRAADALVALACAETVDLTRPADIAATDQMIAAILDVAGRHVGRVA